MVFSGIRVAVAAERLPVGSAATRAGAVLIVVTSSRTGSRVTIPAVVLKGGPC
jgi:hypothetical protein